MAGQGGALPESATRRRIAFVGNCQVEALRNLHHRHVEPVSGDESIFVHSHDPPPDEQLEFVRSADVIVEQVQSRRPVFEASSAASNGVPFFKIPLATGEFLWPFWGREHPRNEEGKHGLRDGPYPLEISDTYLNEAIARGLEPDTAAAEYVHFDLEREVDLDRLFEIVLAKQRLRDTSTGYGTAALIEKSFRKEMCFFSPRHPAPPVMNYLAREFLARFGVPANVAERACKALAAAPAFGHVELPIHPAVRRHFGLEYVRDDYRYRFWDEGRFTFSEYARRYVRCEWNPALSEGVAECRNGRFGEAIRLLDSALQRSPQSASGWFHRGIAQESLGHLDEAARDVERAAHIEPENPKFVNQLGQLASKRGDQVRAVELARRVVELSPDTASYLVALANLLAHSGELKEAKAMFLRAIDLEPSASVYDGLGHALFQLGEFTDSAAAFREASTRAPEVAEYLAHLCHALHAAGDLAGATAAIDAAVALSPRRARFLATLGHVLAADGELEAAGEAFRKALDQDPELEDAREALAHLPSSQV